MSEERMVDKIERWLRQDFELQSNRIHDPDPNITNIAFWPNPQMKMQAVVKGDKLRLILGITYPEDLQRGLKDKANEKSFFNDLNLTLYQQDANFEPMYVEGTKEIKGIMISKIIWEDSLTRTSFFDAVLVLGRCGFIIGIKQEQTPIRSH